MTALLRHGPHAAFTLGRMENEIACSRMRRRADKASINRASDDLRHRFLRYLGGHKSVAQAVLVLGVGIGAALAASWMSGNQRLPAKYHLAMSNALQERGF